MTALDFSTLAGEGATIRLATKEDIPAICDLRVAQSLEYWGVNPGQSELAHFRSETEAHLRRTLGERVMFLFVEEDGEIVYLGRADAEVASGKPDGWCAFWRFVAATGGA